MTRADQVFIIRVPIIITFLSAVSQQTYAKELNNNRNNEAETYQQPRDVPQIVQLNILYYLAGDVEYTPEAQGIPIYHAENLTEPKYFEVKLKPYGYLIASLTMDDLPVVRFNGDENAVAPSEELGVAFKYVTFDESFDVTAIDSSGNIIKSLSNPVGGGNIADQYVPFQERDDIKQQLREKAKEKWSHDYVMECNRDHTIAVCSERLGDGVEELRYPDDFSITAGLKRGGTVWHDELKRFVKLEKNGENWVKGTAKSSWEKDNLSVVVNKRIGKCGTATMNVACDARIYNKPLWVGDTRITIVKESLDEEAAEENALPSSVRRHKRFIWGSWSTWTTYSAADYTTVPNYNVHSCCGCNSGSGAVAWAMMFAWADRRSDFSNTIYGTATELPPTTMTTAVQTYVESIRSAISSYCLFLVGATSPTQMGNARSFFTTRGGGNLQTSYSPLGIYADTYRNCARDEIINNRRPVVLGNVFLKHYPVATQYRTRTRTLTSLFGGSFGTDTAHEAYLNHGWGGSGNGWTNLNTWFCGTISP